ncbi:MAG: M1 family aminopeptidase [Planctomycetota bacterium]|jgi:hypothetical protein
MDLRHLLSKVILCVLLNSISSTIVASSVTANCKYDISAVIDENSTSVQVITKLIYSNDNSKPFDELLFHFTPAPKTSLLKVDERVLVTDSSGQLLKTFAFVRYGKTIDDYFVVKLLKPLNPSSSVKLEIKSKAAILAQAGARVKNLRGCWHPKVVSRANEDWQIGIEEFADYRVTVGPLNNSLIPISGKVIQRQQDKHGRWTITCEVVNIPDFSIVLSHADNVISRIQDNVTINCFYVQDKDRAERILTLAKDVVGFYRNMYGFYPGTLLNVIAYDASGGGGGPIGSNIVYVLRNSLEWGVAHEIGHEYWGWNWVTAKNPLNNWLCLGMGIWSDRQYLQAQNSSFTYYSRSQNKYIKAVRDGLDTKLENLTAADIETQANKKDLAHNKGYAIASMLEYLTSKDVFCKIAKTALDKFAHQPIGTKDFQAICEKISGEDLDWFFQQWVYSNKSLDYAIVNARTTQLDSKQQIVVTIESKGQALMPIDVVLEHTDGSFIRQRIQRDGQLCTFTSEKPWRRVVIDPNHYLPDTNRLNNIIVAFDGKMSKGEAQVIKTFNGTRKKILTGEKYWDASTPLKAFLTVLSCTHIRDIDAFKQINALSHDDDNLNPKLTDKNMTDLEQYFIQYDILRSPLAPEQPQEDTYWPIYVKDRNNWTSELVDTFVFCFRNGKWMWVGNVGSRDDWRNFLEEKLLKWEEKEIFKGDPFLMNAMSSAEHLTSTMSSAEKQLIEKFHSIKKKIFAGEKYEDMSTPVDLLMTVMSAVHSRDAETYKRASAYDKSIETINQIISFWNDSGDIQIDILRAPLPPKEPKHGTFWPIYTKNPVTGGWDDVIVPVFWKGKWQWAGNLGGCYDWRAAVPNFRRRLEQRGK